MMRIWGSGSALIIGVTGQDGACLAEFLLQRGYEVHGIKHITLKDQRSVDMRSPRYGAPFFLDYGDPTDSSNMVRIIEQATTG